MELMFDFWKNLNNYKGILIGNMGYTAAEATAAIELGQIDAVALGSSFLANPDLPEQIKLVADLIESRFVS